ncbi:MAG: cell division protein FtsZ [Candidatus Cloacimonadaceae bacterium]|nr:cell division protein FtsZ [Candidatus Cloacimonadaceae bacterium]MDP3113615.1 cell division protein FtsZ [Candidatus Cloacimonadaceae bacterium]
MIEFDEKPTQIGTNIKIVGVGGAGGNAINTMIANDLFGVEFIAANTDITDLHKSKAKMKLQIGRKLTRGLGTGANPDTGSRSADESKDDIKSHLEGADMVFIAAGMGGGTGTGAAPVIAKIARELGILTLGIVTTPFTFEGKKRHSNAEEGIRNLSEYVDTLIIIPNSKLCDIYADQTLINAFHKADGILFEAAKAVSDIINVSGLVNVDFADVKTIMQNMGHALMGTGTAEGDNRAVMAAKAAINNPLLSDINLHGCQSLLINVTAGPDIIMNEFEEVSSVIVNETGSAANIIMGIIIDPNMVGKVSVTIIATGLNRNEGQRVLDFPKLPISQPGTGPQITKTKSDDEEIEDIFTRLNINQPAKKDDKDQRNQDEVIPMPLTPRTDLPSFLKALD